MSRVFAVIGLPKRSEVTTMTGVQTRPAALVLALALLVAAAPRRAQCDEKTSISNSIGMTLVLIPAGEFLMGSPEADRDAQDDERPQHPVRITRPFYLGATEVTQGQYRALMGENPSFFKGSDDLPVERVSWNDAIEFCNKLSEREGLKPYYQGGERTESAAEGYRLPTEAEWEYACRAGSNARYNFGDDAGALASFGWCDATSGNATHPVRQKRPNDWGLFDMHGNVWEWCGDAYDAGYYRKSKTADPAGPLEAESRVNRGGAWSSPPLKARSAFRRMSKPDLRGFSMGLRVARVQPGR
jgi:formylglycine-generating enzyme required for sulfatase activity